MDLAYIIRNTLGIADHWYHYPLLELESKTNGSMIVIKFDDLTKNPANTIFCLFNEMNYSISVQYEEILLSENQKTKEYSSKHEYYLEEYGLTATEIERRYSRILDNWK